MQAETASAGGIAAFGAVENSRGPSLVSPIGSFGNDGEEGQRSAFKILSIVTAISQLGQIVDDDDATCSGPSRSRIRIRRSESPQMLLSQRREMPQLPQLGADQR